MSLERFEAKKNIIHPLLFIAFINFIFILILLVVSTTIFARPVGIVFKIPTASLAARGQQVEIVITSENVIYVDGRVMTLNELRHFLTYGDFRFRSLMIKADRRAFMGRLADVLDLCRGITGAVVNVSTIF